jgi:hypothetical protein
MELRAARTYLDWSEPLRRDFCKEEYFSRPSAFETWLKSCFLSFRLRDLIYPLIEL